MKNGKEFLSPLVFIRNQIFITKFLLIIFINIEAIVYAQN